MFEGYTRLKTDGWSDSQWPHREGDPPGSHPVFPDGFGAQIIIADTYPPMQYISALSIQAPIPFVIESPQEPYLSTAAQDVSLRVPYTATWWKRNGGVVSEYASANSSDISGRRSGPTGEPLDHITIARVAVPAPGGRSCTLDPHALWFGGQAEGDRLIDPNFTWDFYDDAFVLIADPRFGDEPSHIWATFTWVTATDEVYLYPMRIFNADNGFAHAVLFDEVQQACQQANVSPDGGLLQIRDRGLYTPTDPPIMGYANPDWGSMTIAHWGVAEGTIDTPLFADIVADQTNLLDLEAVAENT